MSRPNPQRQRFAITLSQTVYHTVQICASDADEAERIAARTYDTKYGLIAHSPPPDGWQRRWADFRIESVTPLTSANRKDHS